MADILYFSQLNAIGTIPDDKIIAVQSDPFSGAKGFKATMLEVKDYVNAGRTGGKTIDGGDATTETLSLRNNAIDDLGLNIIASGLVQTNVTNYEALVLANNDIPNKKYVDDAILVENIWDRDSLTTTITVHYAGDDIDFSTAGLIQTATFDSTNISHYDSHPTFTGTTDIVDKKYVDDTLGLMGHKDVLTISSPGETAFTLTAAPTNTATMLVHVRGKFYDYGFGFTVSGTTLTWLNPEGVTLETTDRFVAIYDYDIAASPFSQYWQKVGSTLKPVTASDDVEVKDLHIGQTTSGTIDGNTDIAMALISTGTGDLGISASGTGDLNLDSTGGKITVNSANPIEITGTFDSTKILTYSAHPTFAADAQIVDKKYVDDHETNGIWQRISTTVSLKNAGDDIDFSTAGLIKSGTFDSSNISAYNTHPTFSSDTQIVDKKYVDDQSSSVVAKQEQLTISSPGQIAFTLAQTPSGADSFGLFVNGIQYPPTAYSFVGTALTWGGTPSLKTTDTLLAWYDWQAPSIGFLDQSKIFYVSKSGSDSNDGKDSEKPFLTIGKAITEVLAAGPGISNNYGIEIIGGGTYSESPTIPDYTSLVMENAAVIGWITLGDNSVFKAQMLAGRIIKTTNDPAWVALDEFAHSDSRLIDQTTGILFLDIKKITHAGAPAGDAISCTSGLMYLKSDEIILGINQNPIAALSGSRIFLDVKNYFWNGSGYPAILVSGSSVVYANTGNIHATADKVFNVITSGELFLNAGRLRETVASTTDGTGKVFRNIKDSGLSSETEITNDTGNINLTASTEILVNSYINTIGHPTFDVTTTATVPNITGDGTVYTLKPNIISVNRGSAYSSGTGKFTAPITGMYLFTGYVYIADLTTNHDEFDFSLEIEGGSPATWPLFLLNPKEIRISGAGSVNNYICYNGNLLTKMTIGQTAKFTVTVANGNKVVKLELTSLSGTLITKL